MARPLHNLTRRDLSRGASTMRSALAPARVAITLLMAATIGACSFSPPLGEGQIRCSDGPTPCPPGYSCGSDGRCYSGTSGPDGAVAGDRGADQPVGPDGVTDMVTPP